MLCTKLKLFTYESACFEAFLRVNYLGAKEIKFLCKISIQSLAKAKRFQ